MPTLLISTFLMLSAALADSAASARLLNMREVFTAADYPLVSLRNEEQGKVKVKLTIDRDGRVTSCTVLSSSGHRALDGQTCELFRTRAKFEPAKDRRGRAIESDYTQEIRWQLADSMPLVAPRTAWTMRMTIGVASDGSPVDCKFEFPGAESDHCDASSLRPKENQGAVPAKPVQYAITEILFYPVDPNDVPDPPVLGQALMGARQISRVNISPDGQVIACVPVTVIGNGPDKCRLLNLRFAPAPQASGPAVGTVVQTEYVRDPTPR